jgi:hypothetical protein
VRCRLDRLSGFMLCPGGQVIQPHPSSRFAERSSQVP